MFEIDNIKKVYRRSVPITIRRLLRQVVQPRKMLFSLYSYHSLDSVVSGPFAGMRFERRCGDLSKLFGTYELELHEVFERLKERRFSTVVDIGAAEGYYAVGAMLWKPDCLVIAYEANPDLHGKIRYLAEINNASSRLEIKGLCNTEQLKALGERLKGAFLIVDIEGYEKELLDPQLIPFLRMCSILVEIHDHEVPGCYNTIFHRFQHSHEMSVYRSRPRKMEEYPLKSFIGNLKIMRSVVIDSISDGRSASNCWLLLDPKR